MRTDEQGEFEFVDVPLGSWYVGIAPEIDLLHEAAGFPAYAERIELRSENEVVELELRVEAGLYLSGTVIDQRGDPVADCSLHASLENAQVLSVGETGRSGDFRIGPLLRGTWLLEAQDSMHNYPPSIARSFQSGTDGIVIQLRVGGSIEGMAVGDASPQLQETSFAIARTDGTRSGRWMYESDDGAFRFSGLLAGSYVISARDGAGAIGISDAISLAEGQALKGVEIKLVPGAKLELRYAGGSKHAACEVFAAGSPINFVMLEKGESTIVAVPAGAIELRWKEWESQVETTQTITVELGEAREFVWDGKP